jgi:hypothetical protein
MANDSRPPVPDYDVPRQAGREAVAELFGGDFNAADSFLGKLYRAGWDVTPRSDLEHQGPYPFVLVRDEDVTGVSGTGIIAEGVEFTGPDGVGVVALRWLSDWPTSVVFHDRGVESVHAVHGHDGRTRVVWR